jgi:puromycin-sensitive aminopeptidase
MAEQKPYRLPTTVIPDRYEIKLTPDLSAATFAGEEKVFVQVLEPVRQVVVNAAELEFQAVSIKGPGGKVVRGNAALDIENEQATFNFPETLNPGRWELQITYSGILNDKLHGFYRSTYKDPNGREKTLASTQFESTDARRAFPCWDEPAFKAVFQVTLVVDQDLTAISNARVLRETPLSGTGKKEVVFADTIKMSTYLVAFIVGEFEGTDPVMVGNAPLRVWAVPGKGHLAKFAREVGAFSLAFFSRYYDIAYPGDKLDLIAIPDFASGAMENLGAITFRETALLLDEGSGGCRVPRECSHVVRRLGDHEMVERTLAERSLCHVHGDARGGRLEARMAPLGQFHRVARGGDASRRLEEHASHRVSRGKTRRSGGYV